MRACAVLYRSPGEGGQRLGAVVEGEHFGADDLVGLMALAGDDDHVPDAGPGQRALYGGLPVRKCLMPVHRTAGKDRKSTRLNSSHITSSYAVFCLKKE